MKKVKLLTAMSGIAIASIGVVAPLTSCSGQPIEPEVHTYKVTINDQFTIDKTEATEGKQLNINVSWLDSTKVVDTNKMSITVGQEKLTSRDYQYAHGAIGTPKGTLSIDRGIINDNVAIELYLRDDTRGDGYEVDVQNISSVDEIRQIPITSDIEYVTEVKDTTFTITWTPAENKTYFSNMLILNIGGKYVYQRSELNLDGFIIMGYVQNGMKVLVPAANFVGIEDEATVKFDIELEETHYDLLVECNTWYAKYFVHGSDKYDSLHSGKDNKDGFDVSLDEYVEFIVDLNKWNNGQGELKGSIYFIFGQLVGQTGLIKLFTANKDHAGKLYYGQVALETKIFDFADAKAIEILEPSGGWGAPGYRQPITGWYQFSGGYSNIQLLFGQEAK